MQVYERRRTAVSDAAAMAARCSVVVIGSCDVFPHDLAALEGAGILGLH